MTAVPDELRAALEEAATAKAAFEALPPSHQREYAQWVDEAKKPETRERRAREAVARIVEDQQAGG